MSMKPTDIEALVKLFQQSGLKQMHLVHEGDELFLSMDANVVSPISTQTPSAHTPAMQPADAPKTEQQLSPAQPETPTAQPEAKSAEDRSNWVAVKAANLGTFYRAPNPDAAPYVDVGTEVSSDTEICMIEVMKLFTTMTAGQAGTVREIVAQDGDMVEFDQVLMWIEPKG
jgi:acetyl-CoA carboxylase biotin carboxyl carrier protein